MRRDEGIQDATVVTTGHEKMRITVSLTARCDGRKMLPYVLVKNKRLMTKIVEKFNGKLIINWARSTPMNDETTADYLRNAIRNKLFGTM